MSVLSNFYPLLGQPTRTTRYEYGTTGIYTHAFLSGCRWARVTLVGGGGKGGNSGKWYSGSSWYYEAGGGGGGGETIVVEWDPSYAQVPHGGPQVTVGAYNGGNSMFWSLLARGGGPGINGDYEGTSLYKGGIGGGLQRLGANDSNTEKPTLATTSYSWPGTSGADDSSTRNGGNSMYGSGGAGGASVSSGPCPNGSAGTGFGAGGGGAGTTYDTSGAGALGTGANGTPGLVVFEEWVY